MRVAALEAFSREAAEIGNGNIRMFSSEPPMRRSPRRVRHASRREIMGEPYLPGDAARAVLEALLSAVALVAARRSRIG